MPAQKAPTSIATRIISGIWSDAGQRQRAADDGGEQRGEAVLAVDADVEQVHPEADGHRERGEVVRRRLVDDQTWLSLSEP